MAVTLVISDIHANPWALQAVLDDAARVGFDDIWFLGDLWGYGPEPYSVWNMLFEHRDKKLVTLAGNHDWAVCGIPAGTMRAEAHAVIKEHQSVLRPEIVEQVKMWPVMCSPQPGVYLAHGEIASTYQQSVVGYVYYPPLYRPDRLVQDFLRAFHTDGPTKKVCICYKYSEPTPARLFMVGHTHKQQLWEWDPVSERWRDRSAPQYTWDNLDTRPIMFNPGSVGFPRDHSGCPAYVTIDWQSHTLSFHRVTYNTAQLKKAMQLLPYKALMRDPQFFVEPTCR